MKHIYTLIAIIFISFSAAQAKPVITFINSYGDWSTASNWDLNRIPQHGDSIVIPQYKGVVFDKNDTLANVYIKVFGGLTIQKRMRLGGVSVIELTGTGKLNALNAQRSSEVISMNGVIKYDENAALLINGPAFATASTGVSPNGFNLSVLPVVFNGFFVTRNNNSIVLNWSTAQESNNSNYEIQRSFDGSNWSAIAIMMGAGNSTTVQQYNYTDKNMTAAVAYYRIKQVDIDGHYTFSTIKSIRSNETAASTRIYASGNTVNIEFNKEVKNPITVRIVNMSGQVVGQHTYQQAAYRITMNLNNSVKGAYVVQLSDNEGWKEVKKIII
ncbi:T9SS type A sorting domain-containing protein [Niastella sp. OAS944]|uniref:T9SS type A sorting domain-containing protein n=1 Tax=Niastella sp. OAS944 TaxID=2664089 RepID=UPI003497AB18|nr:hypothetical protein [Chitinophagaceae bacterium OAS944]